MTREHLLTAKRYVGPALLLVVLQVLWSVWIGPGVNEAMADWNFVRAARIQNIRQAQQAAQAAHEEPKQ